MAAGRRVRCFMDIDVGAGHVSRIIVELYNELCPKTCENFRALCTGELGLGKTSNKPLNYKGTILHRVIKGFMIQGGDISGASGRGGESIYGGLFEDENLKLTHDKPHLLSMANRGPNANGSQFFITTAAAPHLDSRNVVFGEVITGQNIIALIENVPVDRTSRPLTDIKIIKCGQLVLSTKSKAKKKKRAKRGESDSSSSSDSSDSSSEKETPVKEHRKKDKKLIDTPDQLKEPKEEVHPLVSITAINSEDIPAIPVNRLYRGEGSRDGPDRDAGRDRDKPRERNQYRDKDRTFSRDMKESRDRDRDKSQDRNRSRSRVFVRGVTKSGRNIKGRGVFRYRTPSRSRSRSATPPHWKLAQRRTIKMAEFKQKTKEQIEFSEEIRRREQARNARHSTIQHSKSQENAQRLNTDSKESHDKISEINDSQICSSQEDIQKSSKGSKVVSKLEPLSDLEEGETRDEDIVIKEEVVPSPSHTSTAVDYNALDYEAPTEIQDIATNGATTSDDFPDKDLHESWDSKRQSIPSPDEDSDTELDLKKKHRSSKVKDSLTNSKESLSPSAKDVVLKVKNSHSAKSHKTSSNEEETRVEKLSDVKSDLIKKVSTMSENAEDASQKEIEKSEERRKDEEKEKQKEKEWIEMMARKHEEELKRKKALESERKMLQQKKRDKLREIVKKKDKEEELRKLSRDNSKKSKRRAPSTSSSSSSSSDSSSKRRHSSKSRSRRTSVKQRRSRSPARRSRSPVRRSRSPIIQSRSQVRRSRSPTRRRKSRNRH